MNIREVTKLNQSVLLEYVDDTIFESEINVLASMAESYQKALKILECVDYDENVIQESFSLYMKDFSSDQTPEVFQESLFRKKTEKEKEQDAVDRQNAEHENEIIKRMDDKEKELNDRVARNDVIYYNRKSSIKNLFKRIISFFKSVCTKLSGLIKRCYDINKKKYMITYNMLRVIDELNRVFSSKAFNEYVAGEIDDEVFQEALIRKKTEKEKEQDEIDKRSAKHEKEIIKRMDDKEKEHNKNIEAYDKEYKKFVRALRIKFKPDVFTRTLSRKDISDIVKTTCLGANKDELVKLRRAVGDITNGNFEKVDEKIFETLKLVVHTSRAVGEFKTYKEHNKIRKNVVISDKQKAIAEKNINRDTTAKTLYDIELLEKFADTFGLELNRISGRDHFSAENLKALIYGPNKILTIPATVVTFTASTVFNLLTKAAFALSMFNPKIILDGIRYAGEELNHMDDEFSAFSDNDRELRKEFGIRLNKVMDVVRFGAIDNLAEETYRWGSDPFNALTYGQGNITSTIAAGPFTLFVMLISTIVFHKPLEDFYPTLGTVAMMGFAKALNPGDRGEFSYLAPGPNYD